MTPLNIENLERLLAEAKLTVPLTLQKPMMSGGYIYIVDMFYHLPLGEKHRDSIATIATEHTRSEEDQRGTRFWKEKAHLPEQRAALIVAAVNALSQLLAAAREGERYRAALERIERWELPPSGGFYTNGDGSISDRPVPYDSFYAYGAQGGKAAIQAIARQALHPTPREGK